MSENSEYTKIMLQTAIEIAEEEKADHIANLLKRAELSLEQTHYDNWNNGVYYFTIFLTVDVKTYVSVKNNLPEIEAELLNRIQETARRSDNEIINQLTIVPKSGTIIPEGNPHRPLSPLELEKKQLLGSYLGKTSEDQLIGEVLMPLFRHLGFHRITVAGHKDKALEYGKDIWMKFVLPTQNILYFGIQVKKDKLDASGVSKSGTANVAEILNQVTMMLGHEIFDPEINRKVLVDHAFIVAGGEITKQARNWLASKLDVAKRSQVMFLEGEDILNLYIVNNISLPSGALPPAPDLDDDNLPF